MEIIKEFSIAVIIVLLLIAELFIWQSVEFYNL